MLNDLEILLIGVAVMLLMALSVIFFVVLYQKNQLRHKAEKQLADYEKQRAIALASIQSEEQERKRIAAELHDDVGANLSAVNLLLSAALKQTEPSTSIQEAKNLVSLSLQTIRGIAYKIHPSPLQNLGLQAAIENYLNILAKTKNINIHFTCEQNVPRFDEAAELNIYRIFQEFVTNITKYAKPKLLITNLYFHQKTLCLLIEHDGKGMLQQEFETKLKNPNGLGLQNIKHRLEIHNGNCKLSFHNNRFQILISVPTIQDL